MPAKRGRTKDIQSKVLLMVQHTEFQEGQKATDIRVIDWILDGSKHYPQLEKRELFMGEQGEWKMGKAKGFSAKDLELIQDKWGEIMAALGNKLPERQQSPGSTVPAPAAVPAGIDSDF